MGGFLIRKGGKMRCAHEDSSGFRVRVQAAHRASAFRRAELCLDVARRSPLGLEPAPLLLASPYRLHLERHILSELVLERVCVEIRIVVAEVEGATAGGHRVSSRPHLLGALASWDVRRRVRRLFRSAASWVVVSTDYAMWETCFLQKRCRTIKRFFWRQNQTGTFSLVGTEAYFLSHFFTLKLAKKG